MKPSGFSYYLIARSVIQILNELKIFADSTQESADIFNSFYYR